MDIQNMFDLSSKTAIVTGGSGGIGFACAKAVAAYGASVLLTGTNREELKKHVNMLKSEGYSAYEYAADILDYDAVKGLRDYAVDTMGKIDILIHSAAVTIRKPIEKLEFSEWKKVIDVNLNASFVMGKLIGEEMIKNKAGKIIFISSTGAIRAGVNFSAYSASKAGMTSLMQTLALEYAPYGINVNAIAATATETNFTREYYNENPHEKQAVINNHPFKRLATTEDYMGAAVFLASEASDFVNGALLVVDSGKTIK